MRTNIIRTPRKRIPLEVEQTEYQALQAWAIRNGFRELAPAIRWGLRQVGALTTEPPPLQEAPHNTGF